MMRLSARAKDKVEMSRWLRRGIELAVIDPETNRSIQQTEGEFEIVEHGWRAKVALRNRLVVKIQ